MVLDKLNLLFINITNVTNMDILDSVSNIIWVSYNLQENILLLYLFYYSRVLIIYLTKAY